MRRLSFLVVCFLSVACNPSGDPDVAFVGDQAAEPVTFDSYPKAWRHAHDMKLPMVVILNPAEDQGEGIDVESLRTDNEISSLLDKYVVAAIDTGSETGQKVHELFGNKPLPRVVIIDKKQDLQIYRTSDQITMTKWKEILETYYDYDPNASLLPTSNLPWYPQINDCPNCRRGVRF